ncbi:MAG: hypothetical protein RBT16_01540, partial [Desulfococcus multivorans]|nr:hypothetical protein [Desulfococcus multivorans]
HQDGVGYGKIRNRIEKAILDVGQHDYDDGNQDNQNDFSPASSPILVGQKSGAAFDSVFSHGGLKNEFKIRLKTGRY